MKGSWSPAGVREALWKLEKFQGPGSRREGIQFKSASLRGRRSERQAGEVTPKTALTDEFTCGQEKGAFQEEKQWMPRFGLKQSPRAPDSWTWRGCICWEGVSPRLWHQGLTALSDQKEAETGSTLPGKRLAGVQVSWSRGIWAGEAEHYGSEAGSMTDIGRSSTSYKEIIFKKKPFKCNCYSCISL